MSQILLFTNNPLNEQPFEERLRQLGHEVFTTKAMINFCLIESSMKDFIKIFHHIILSETLSNAEVQELLGILRAYSIPIYRKSNELLKETQLEEWKDQGITEWIEINPSIEVLRETLSSDIVKQGKVVFLSQRKDKRELSSLKLSSGEVKLFRILYRQQANVLSREEICLKMWDRGKNNSTMSQLSVLVKHLKDKLSQQQVDGPIIETCWGQGYKLDKTVYDQIYVEEEAKMM
ncbi:helix-turn-helix domain-containing protein [Enterococcus sp. DIV0756]|uniref:helix-turn-helix domain-containing protein n=1 Tax=Enterococcus sp. DIV0756 TaxID=2774636 RepID=UPI003F26BBC2